MILPETCGSRAPKSYGRSGSLYWVIRSLRSSGLRRTWDCLHEGGRLPEPLQLARQSLHPSDGGPARRSGVFIKPTLVSSGRAVPYAVRRTSTAGSEATGLARLVHLSGLAAETGAGTPEAAAGAFLAAHGDAFGVSRRHALVLRGVPAGGA